MDSSGAAAQLVSLMSDAGVAVEDIDRLVGHKGTEKVYRKQLRPILLEGADVMDRIFNADTETA
ncbi:hypothetical protein GCM10023259_023150 [Thermocatellispora tengchongensis]